MTALLVIILLLYCLHLHRRLGNVENALKDLNDQNTLDSVGVKENKTTQSALAPTTAAYSPSRLAKPHPTHRHNDLNLQYWLTSDGLLKVGALLVLLGMGWFVSYAFAENWIGPIGRISMGLLVGTLLMVAGEFLTTKHLRQGIVFLGLGTTTILLTIFAARTVYDFFTPLSAMAVMLVAIAYTSFSAVFRQEPIRCFIAVVGAAVVPFLVTSDSSSSLTLLAYLLLISIGFLWVVALTGWRWLTFAIAIIYAIYSILISSSLENATDNTWSGIILTLETILIFASSFIMHLKHTTNRFLEELGASTIVTFLSIWWIHLLIAPDLQSLLSTLIGISLFMAAYLLFQLKSSRPLIFQYTLLSLTMLAAAATFGFDGPVVQVSYACLVATAALLAFLVLNSLSSALKIGLLLIPLSLYNYIKLIDFQPLNTNTHYESLAVLTLIAIIVAALGWYFYHALQSPAQDTDSLGDYPKYYLVASYLQSLLLVWHYAEFYLHSSLDTAHAIALVVISVLGITGYIVGLRRNSKIIHNTSLLVLAAVLIRLMLVEVWDMRLIERVILFVFIGGLFMSTSFLKKAATPPIKAYE